MKWFLIDQLRLLIGIVVLGITGTLLLLGWCWFANLPWLSAVLHTSLAKFIFMIVTLGAAGAALYISQGVFWLIGVPLNLNWPDEQSAPKLARWRTWALLGPTGIALFLVLEYGLSNDFLRSLGTVLELTAKNVLRSLRPAMELASPLIASHRGALKAFITVAYVGLLLVPVFDLMIVLRRLLRISRD